MNDDQLHDELERRSNAAPFRAQELLPQVRRGIGGRSARPARVTRWAPLAGLAAAVVVVLALVLAIPRSIPPGEPGASPSHVPQSSARSASDKSGDFTLTLTSPKSVYVEGEEILAAGELAYSGSKESTTLYGSGGELVGYGVNQIGGTIRTEPVFTADCGPHVISADHPLREPFRLSGGFDSNDPAASFLRALFTDPAVHLPPGSWEISAVAIFDEGSTCTANPTQLRASITVEVVPRDTASTPSAPGTP